MNSIKYILDKTKKTVKNEIISFKRFACAIIYGIIESVQYGTEIFTNH